MRVKYKDIAQKLGISPSTVSLVVNNKAGVNEETRQRVLAYLKNTGISTKPSSGGRGKYIRFLKYSKFGKVVDDHGFISSVTDGIAIGARELGYDVLITTFNSENKESVMDMVKNDQRRGILLLGTELTYEDLDILNDIKVPVVIVDSFIEFEEYDCVTMNNIDIAYRAVKYLYDKGFTEIGHFRSGFRVNNFLGRREGYRRALRKFGLEYNPDYTFILDPTLEGSYADMKRLLEAKPKLPPAVFSDNDTVAVGAIKALKEFGYRIPEDVAIIGVDDIPFCTMIEPTLTTMAIYKEEIGSLAAKRLIEKVETGDKSILKMLVNAELIEREST
jgi:DNA-binding LacI/PurR family transcriptional regulator